MKDPLDVSPSKGNQGTALGKEKKIDLGGNRTHDLRIISTVTLPTELRGRPRLVRVVPKSYRSEGQPRSTRSEFPLPAIPIWRTTLSHDMRIAGGKTMLINKTTMFLFT